MGVGEPVGDGGPYAREHGAGERSPPVYERFEVAPDTYSTTM